MSKKILALLLISKISLSAHSGAGEVSGFMSGLAHPGVGADHILAMFAVGLLAAQMGGRALLYLPLSFIGVMSAGAAVGIHGVNVPFVEEGILASVLVFGAIIGFGAKMPIAAICSVVGVFAIFHGAAHGSEMPLNINGFEYGAGFVFATAMLHMVGIAIGAAINRAAKSKFLRLMGGAITAAGAALIAA